MGHFRAKCCSRLNDDASLKDWQVCISASTQNLERHLRSLMTSTVILSILLHVGSDGLTQIFARRMCARVPKEPGLRGEQASNGSQKVVMRHVYMLSPRTERLGSEIAAHVYTFMLVRV